MYSWNYFENMEVSEDVAEFMTNFGTKTNSIAGAMADRRDIAEDPEKLEECVAWLYQNNVHNYLLERAVARLLRKTGRVLMSSGPFHNKRRRREEDETGGRLLE